MKNSIMLSLFGLIFIASGCLEQSKGSTDGSKDQASDASGNNSSDLDESPALNPDNSDTNDPTEFEKEFSRRFAEFKSVSPKVLEAVITKIPAQNTKWGCGLHQSEAAIEIAHINHKQKRPGFRNFMAVGHYPLAIDVNIKDPAMQGIASLASAVSGVGLPHDDQGNFRVGALPHDLADYIDANLPKTFPLEALAISKDSLEAKELLNIVNANIDLGMSTPTFCVVDPNSFLIHVYSVVGSKGDDLLILDTTGQSLDRFSVQKASDFLLRMDAANEIRQIKSMVKLGDVIGLRSAIAKAKGKAAKQETFDQWKAFSLIKFQKDQ